MLNIKYFLLQDHHVAVDLSPSDFLREQCKQNSQISFITLQRCYDGHNIIEIILIKYIFSYNY